MGEGQTFLAKEPSVLTQLIIRGLKREFLGQKERTGPSDAQLSPRELLKIEAERAGCCRLVITQCSGVWVGTARSLPWEAKTEEQISAAVVTDSLYQAEAA